MKHYKNVAKFCTALSLLQQIYQFSVIQYTSFDCYSHQEMNTCQKRINSQLKWNEIGLRNSLFTSLPIYEPNNQTSLLKSTVSIPCTCATTNNCSQRNILTPQFFSTSHCMKPLMFIKQKWQLYNWIGYEYAMIPKQRGGHVLLTGYRS